MSFLRRILPSGRSFVLYLAGFACLTITALMNRHAGISQAATEQGRDLLGYSSIIVDIVGLVVFGSVAGNLLASGKRAIGYMVLAVTIASGIYSIGSIMTFVATEWLSVAESRKHQIQALHDKEDETRRIREERLKIQAQAGQAALAAMQAQVKDATTRKERTVLSKNFAAGANQVIEALGKENQVAPAPANPVEEKIQLRPDAGAEAVSWITSLPERTYQITRMAMLACLLIAFKMLAFPLGGYYYSQKREAIDLVPVPSIEIPAAPSQQLATVDVPKVEPQRLLASPTPIPVATPKTPPVPAMAKHWRELLDQLDMPRKKPLGALRPRPKREHLGWRFYAWICANDLSGTYTSEELTKLYDRHTADVHEEQWGINVAKGELRSAARKMIVTRDSKAPTIDTITAMPYERLRERLIKYKVLVPTKAPESTMADHGHEPEKAKGVAKMDPKTAAAVATTAAATGASVVVFPSLFGRNKAS